MLLDALLDADRRGLPDAPDAVVLAGHPLSRGDLLAAAHRLAAALPDGPVAVHATADVGTVEVVLAGLLAGVPVVPVPPDAGPAEREHVLRDSRAVAWLGPTGLGGGLPPVVPDGSGSTWHAPAVDPDATALVLYTSGTTGAPKGVEISQRALAATIDGVADAWSWTADDVLVHGLPLFHLHGLVLGVLGPLRLGSRVVHTGRPTPDAYARAASLGGTVFFGVPTVWHRVAGDPDAARALSGARLLVSGSAPLPVTTYDAVRGLTGLAPVERYGMTETGITLAARSDEEPRAGWVGRPVRGVSTRLVGEDGAVVPDDGESIGRLHVRGPSLFSGYLGRPDATAATYDGDWFVTGDLAVRDPADLGGLHRIVGRESTDLIKTGGYRVGSGEVEAVLLEHPDVDEVAVVGLPDPDLGQRITAYVVGPARPGLADALVELVATRLSVHKRPREVRFVDSLPRNAMGKVQKKQLPDVE